MNSIYQTELKLEWKRYKSGNRKRKIYWTLHKPLKSFLSGFTNRTDPRWFVHGREVSANLASPYWLWKFSCEFHIFYHLGSFLFFFSFNISLLFGRAPFWNRFHASFSPDDLVRNIERTVTGSIVIQIGISIVAWTDNVQVFFQIIGREPARAGPIAVPPLVDEQPPYKLFCKLDIRIEVISRRFYLLIQMPVDFVHKLICYTFLGSFFLFQPNIPL